LDISLTVDEPRAIKSDIKRIILNPAWKPKDARYDADIAILVLRNPIEYSEVIQPVCLPNSSYSPIKTAGTVGKYA